MAQFNRFNSAKKIAETRESIAWGKKPAALLFATLLTASLVTVGCSKDKPQPISNQTPVTQSTPAVSSSLPPALPAPQTASKPKKAARKRPATVTYADKTYGVSFQYPRKYALETGDAANELIASSPVSMDFVQPGGIALAAVALPDSSYPGTDFESGLFNVSINKSLTAEECGQFTVPQSDPKAASDSGTQAKTEPSKLMLGDLEMQSAENVVGEGPTQSDTKYFHVFQNGACYEFVLKVATNGSDSEHATKHVDRDKVFQRLETFLATVKIAPVAAPEVAASAPKEAPKEPATPEAPAQ